MSTYRCFEVENGYVLRYSYQEITEGIKMSDRYLFYVGAGKGTLIGVPARDLSYDEAKRYGITQLLASGLYVYNSNHAIPKEYKKDLLLDNPVEEKPKRKWKKEESE